MEFKKGGRIRACTLLSTSMAITNVIGPVERMALANHPVKGIYFMLINAPQSLTISVVSYKGTLRVAVGAEKGFIDAQELNSCIVKAFEEILEAACKHPSQAN